MVFGGQEEEDPAFPSIFNAAAVCLEDSCAPYSSGVPLMLSPRMTGRGRTRMHDDFATDLLFCVAFSPQGLIIMTFDASTCGLAQTLPATDTLQSPSRPLAYTRSFTSRFHN
nr:hypothetical protein CFP56_04359 [Quercus suber]